MNTVTDTGGGTLAAAAPPSGMQTPHFSRAAWLAEQHARRQVALDKWVLGGIIVERFVTRLFSDKLGLLPGWTNFLDYPLLFVFAAYVLLSVRHRPAAARGRTGFEPLVLGLLVVFAVSALFNLGRLHPGAATLFFIGLFEPLAYMALAYVLAPKKEVLGFLVNLLIAIGWLQVVVVVLLDLPRFLATRNPDYISGTFGENAYQLTFFLLAWNVLVVSRPSWSRFQVLAIPLMLLVQALIIVIFLLAQYRSFLPFAVLTWVISYFVINRGSARSFIAAMAGAAFFAFLFTQVALAFPELRWNETLEIAARADETYQSGKVQSVLNYFQMVTDHPEALLVGTGPGTYASRGFRTFSVVGRDDTVNGLYRSLFNTEYYMTDVAARYVMPVINNYAFGAASTTVPWFSFLSIPAELGIPGLIIVLALYCGAVWMCWRRVHDSDSLGLLAGWTFIALLLLVQMAWLENWLEVSRLTVPVWVMFGIVLAAVRQAEAESPSLVKP
jgi:hypothetical protein